MENKKIYTFYLLVGLFFAPLHSLFASEIIVLSDSVEQYEVTYNNIEIYEDKTSALTIHKISSPSFTRRFSNNKIQLPRNINLNSTYWIKFTIRNQTYSDKNWLFECFDSSIEDISLYMPDGTGGFIEQKAGNKYRFDNKFYKHKNFEFYLPDIKGSTFTFYARVKSSRLVFMYGVIRTYNKFVAYALSEYFYLGLFYGIILALALYNMLLFITIKDKTYIYYVLYVLSSGLLCMVMDGTGFQYLWPNHPEYNVHAFSFTTFFMVIWAIMYIQGFVILKSSSRFHVNLLELAIIARITLFILSYTIFPELKDTVFIDVVALFICYISGIISLKSGNISTRYFVLGFSFLFVGFVISNLTVNSIFGFTLHNTVYTVYSFNFGIVLEMILLSYALADRVKLIMKENADAQDKLIEQLQAQDRLKEIHTRELEGKVTERTKEIYQQKSELEQKNEELNILYEEIRDNIKVAKWIQESILPPMDLIRKHLKECYVVYKPKDVVSGDFYWFDEQGGRAYIAAVDCTGHGVSGAFMSIIGYNILNQTLKNSKNHKLNAGEILDKLNEQVIDTLRQKQKDALSRDGMDINLCIIDFKNRKLDYAGAVNYLYIIRNKELIKLIADPFSIGIPKSGVIEKFSNHEFELETNDMLIQYTDGYADQLGGDSGYKKFLYPQFRDMFVRISDLSIEEQYQIVSNTIEEWRGSLEQTDDILIIGTRFV